MTPRLDGPVLEIGGLGFARGPGREDFRLELPVLTLAPGDFVAVAGESGSGKSTLLGLLGCLARPTKLGSFRLLGEEVAPDLLAGALDRLAPLRRRAIGFVLQHGGLLPFLNVEENIALAAPADRSPPLSVGDLAERLGIAGNLLGKPGTLSVGQRQRVAIARAIMADPAVILADEPTAALDPPTAKATLELFRDVATERGTAVLMATHAWALVESFGLPVVAHGTAESHAGPVARFALRSTLGSSARTGTDR